MQTETKGVTKTVSYILFRFNYLNLFPIGSEAKESSQLTGKAGNDNQLDLKRALVCIMFIGDGKCIGGGALLSRTTVIVPMIIFLGQYRTYHYRATNYFAGIGLDSFINRPPDSRYSLTNIIENIDLNGKMEEALGLVIIEPTSLAGNNHPSWVPHIPLATQSYIPGEHRLLESFVAWSVVSMP